MRVKIFKAENLSDVERDMNLFLMERKDIRVTDIRELKSNTNWVFIILYEIKE
jgi:hypothetical protein